MGSFISIYKFLIDLRLCGFALIIRSGPNPLLVKKKREQTLMVRTRVERVCSAAMTVLQRMEVRRATEPGALRFSAAYADVGCGVDRHINDPGNRPMM
jgi:hypothetical protein